MLSLVIKFSLCMLFQIVKGLGLTAISCMVDVLASLNHFNYRTNLIVAVVSKVNFGGERAEVISLCANCNLYKFYVWLCSAMYVLLCMYACMYACMYVCMNGMMNLWLCMSEWYDNFHLVTLLCIHFHFLLRHV